MRLEDERAPIPALADSDNGGRMLLSFRELRAAIKGAAVAVARFADAVWPVVEGLPPGHGLDGEE